MDRGTGRPAAAAPLKATPYPTRSTEPPAPKRVDPLPPVAATAAGEMLRGFVKDGSIVLLGGKSLPDGVFVKVIRE